MYPSVLHCFFSIRQKKNKASTVQKRERQLYSHPATLEDVPENVPEDKDYSYTDSLILESAPDYRDSPTYTRLDDDFMNLCLEKK